MLFFSVMTLVQPGLEPEPPGAPSGWAACEDRTIVTEADRSSQHWCLPAEALWKASHAQASLTCVKPCEVTASLPSIVQILAVLASTTRLVDMLPLQADRREPPEVLARAAKKLYVRQFAALASWEHHW